MSQTQTDARFRFHIGHVYKVQGKFSAAKEVYEGLLAREGVDTKVRASTLRQVGSGRVGNCMWTYLISNPQITKFNCLPRPCAAANSKFTKVEMSNICEMR